MGACEYVSMCACVYVSVCICIQVPALSRHQITQKYFESGEGRNKEASKVKQTRQSNIACTNVHEAAHFSFGKVTVLGVLCCFALWPCLLLSSLLFHLSLTCISIREVLLFFL